MRRLQDITHSSIMTLQNAGGIGGCKCYSTSAATCGMLTLASDSFVNPVETIRQIMVGEPLSHLQAFDDSRCVEKKKRTVRPQVRHEERLSKYYLFISIPTLGDMFDFGKWYSKNIAKRRGVKRVRANIETDDYDSNDDSDNDSDSDTDSDSDNDSDSD